MLDAALIEKCADPSLKPAIVEKFVKAAGSPDPLTIVPDQRLRDQTGLIEKRGFSAHRSSTKGSEDETENRAADIGG